MKIDGNVLLCENCGHNNLHHDLVEVFDRKEDATDGLHVSVCEGLLKCDQNMSDNPSARRHGLRVSFWCEGCTERTYLTIDQHKGQTFIGVGLR